MTKTRYQPPETILDLENVFYKGDGGSINRYNKWLQSPKSEENEISISESHILDFLNQIGGFKKIPEKDGIKTFDFVNEKEKLLVEVKSINTVYENTSENTIFSINLKKRDEWVKKINLTIKDIEAKDKQEHKEFCVMGTIYIDSIQTVFEQQRKIFESDFIKETNFLKSKLNALLIYPAKFAGTKSKIIGRKIIEEPYPNIKPTLYSKNDNVAHLFSKINKSELDIIKCTQ